MKNEHLLSDRIAKLPEWARKHIETLERQREEAIRRLRQFTNTLTKQPFYIDELACLTSGAPESVRRYIEAHWIRFDHRGLDISIMMREDGVHIQYGQHGGMKDILFQPTSYQSFTLKYPEQGT